jgi:hypothetical protein
MADVDVAFSQQVLDVPQTQRKAQIIITISLIISGDELK